VAASSASSYAAAVAACVLQVEAPFRQQLPLNFAHFLAA